MRILVTGAMGFVGINVLRDLAMAGHEVVGVDVVPPDDVAARFMATAPPVRTVVADLGGDGLAAALAAEAPTDVVIHAAAVTPLGEFELEQAVAAASINVAGTARIMEWARKAGVRRVVHVSTGSVYGSVSGDRPVDEETPQQPDAVYGITKSAGERLAARMASLADCSFCAVRLSHVYGPMERPSAVRGISSAIERWTRALISGRVIPAPRHDVLRDFVHVSDVGRAIGRLAVGRAGGAFNVSSGEQTSEVELVRLLQEIDPALQVAGGAPSAVLSPTRPPLATGRIAAAIGWRPEIGLADGLRSYVEWRRESGV